MAHKNYYVRSGECAEVLSQPAAHMMSVRGRLAAVVDFLMCENSSF
jgi:hypothetical protein